MGKTKRATRKELETGVQEIIGELSYLRQGFTAIDNYLGAYVQYKGDAINFHEHLQKKMEEKRKENMPKEQPKTKDVKRAKRERYDKVKSTAKTV